MSSAFQAVDFSSPAGAALKKFVEGRLDEERAKLEDPQLTERDTQLTRGAIRELRRLLRPAPQQVVTPRYSVGAFNHQGGTQ